MKTRPMLMKSRTKQKSASSSAINGGGNINRFEVEVINNTESSNHWDFLDEIEAPMWADLSVCNLNNDETDDPWFNVSHEFHQCSSSQLVAAIICPTNSITIQEPSSPKLPSSVSKSRGKNYKIKQWEQRKCRVMPNKQHLVKTLAKSSSMSSGSNDKMKTVSRTGKAIENGVEVCSSVGSNKSDAANNTRSKSSLPSIAKTEQEHENSSTSTITSDDIKHQKNKCSDVSYQTSSETSKLLSSLRVNLRRSCATRPAARAVITNGGRCSEGSSSNSSVVPPLSKKHVLGDARNKLRVLKTPGLNVGSLSNRKGDNITASKVTTKGKVQQCKSHGKVLMPRDNNKQNQSIDKKIEKAGIGKRTPSMAIIKETTLSTMGHVQKASKQNLTQKNGTKKPISLKEKTTNRGRDTDTSKPARKVYFR